MEILQFSDINIDKISENTGNWLREHKLERRNVLQISLLMEEILLRFRDHFGPEKEFSFATGKRFGRSYLCISVEGEEFNPMEISEEDNAWADRMLANLGLQPAHSYIRGSNRITLNIRKQRKIGENTKILIAILAAVITGAAGEHLFPEHTAQIAAKLLEPIQSSVMNIFVISALPLIFLMVMTGIFGMGSMSEFRKTGTGILKRFMGVTLLYALVSDLIILAIFNPDLSGKGINAGNIYGILNLFLDMIPQNILEPFITGNVIQIIILALIAGIAMLVLDNRTVTLRNFAEEANSLGYILVEWVCRLTPLLIFVIIINHIWTENSTDISIIMKPVIIMTAASVITMISFIAYGSIRYKIPLTRLIKKLAASMITAFFTNSSAATYGVNKECCEKKLGLSRKLTGVGSPLGSIIFKPASVMYFFTFALFAAEYYGIELSAATLISSFILAFILEIAIPPVSGSEITCYALLITQLNLPQEAMMFLIPIGLICDRFGTAGNIIALDIELISLADKYKLLDRNILNK